MLRCEGVSVRLGGKEIVHQASFVANRGCVTALLGKNGSGKSTLLRCMVGLVPYRGSMRLCDQDIRKMPARARAKRISYLPQMLPDTHLTVYQLCAMGCSAGNASLYRLTEADEKSIREAMKQVAAEAFADRDISTLSGGEKQRAFLAMMLCQGGDVLLLDEPGAYLDEDAKGHLYKLLVRLAKEMGKAVLLVMHEIGEAMTWADQVVILEKGKTIFSGSREECLRSRAVETHFGLTRYTAKHGDEEMVFFR